MSHLPSRSSPRAGAAIFLSPTVAVIAVRRAPPGHNPSLEHSSHAQPEGRRKQDHTRRAWCLLLMPSSPSAACPKLTLPCTDAFTLSVSPPLFSSTDHDDALTQARGGDSPSPLGRLPRDAERGEWRETLCEGRQAAVWGARGGHGSGAAGRGRIGQRVGGARAYRAHLVFVLSWAYPICKGDGDRGAAA